MRGLSPNWLLGTETLHLYIRRSCQIARKNSSGLLQGLNRSRQQNCYSSFWSSGIWKHRSNWLKWFRHCVLDGWRSRNNICRWWYKFWYLWLVWTRYKSNNIPSLETTQSSKSAPTVCNHFLEVVQGFREFPNKKAHEYVPLCLGCKIWKSQCVHTSAVLAEVIPKLGQFLKAIYMWTRISPTGKEGKRFTSCMILSASSLWMCC